MPFEKVTGGRPGSNRKDHGLRCVTVTDLKARCDSVTPLRGISGPLLWGSLSFHIGHIFSADDPVCAPICASRLIA